MKAWTISQYGDADVFSETEVEKPSVGINQVLIKVIASSVNPIDVKIRTGAAAIGPDFPSILNADVSGHIVETGANVGSFKVGDAVYGCIGGVKGSQGALADFVVADCRLLSLAPFNLPLNESAVLPLAGITAWIALFDKARIKQGQWVLIQGGTGGVGHIAIQIAKARGANVIATCGTYEKCEEAYNIGALAAFNYKTTDVQYWLDTVGIEGFDVVFDTSGGDSFMTGLEALSNGGQLVTINARMKYDLTQAHGKGISIHAVFMLLPLLTGDGRERYGEILKELAELVDDGQLKPLIDSHNYQFDQISEAHKYMESGQVIGKLLLNKVQSNN
jgi:NADPH2:quinone reductase